MRRAQGLLFSLFVGRRFYSFTDSAASSSNNFITHSVQGERAVKLCTNKMLQFLTEGGG